MNLNPFRIYSLGLLFIFFSCTNLSNSKKVVHHVGTNEILLVLNERDIEIMLEGEHLINKESKTISFNKIDSIAIKEFDIMDANAQTLYCKPTVKYKLTPEHIRNIAKNYKWITDIQAYKKILIEPEIRTYLRDIGFDYQEETLTNQDFVSEIEIEQIIGNKLKNFIDLESIEVKIYKK